MYMCPIVDKLLFIYLWKVKNIQGSQYTSTQWNLCILLFGAVIYVNVAIIDKYFVQ